MTKSASFARSQAQIFTQPEEHGLEMDRRGFEAESGQKREERPGVKRWSRTLLPSPLMLEQRHKRSTALPIARCPLERGKSRRSQRTDTKSLSAKAWASAPWPWPENASNKAFRTPTS